MISDIRDTRPVDVVYILAKGSLWQDNEIRYSLRSVEKYLKHYRNVYVIGYKPKFLNDNVTEIPFKDIYSNKSRNIMAKIYRASSDSRITGNFLLFNDDYFLLKETIASLYPYYYNHDLIKTANNHHNSYKFYVESTLKVLKSADKPILNFDIHKPILYNKVRFRKMVDQYFWNIPRGYIVKSMYCNHYGIKGIQINDHKINYPHRIEQIVSMNENEDMFSIGDKALNSSMKKYLDDHYPLKSIYEL